MENGSLLNLKHLKVVDTGKIAGVSLTLRKDEAANILIEKQ